MSDPEQLDRALPELIQRSDWKGLPDELPEPEPASAEERALWEEVLPGSRTSSRLLRVVGIAGGLVAAALLVVVGQNVLTQSDRTAPQLVAQIPQPQVTGPSPSSGASSSTKVPRSEPVSSSAPRTREAGEKSVIPSGKGKAPVLTVTRPETQKRNQADGRNSKQAPPAAASKSKQATQKPIDPVAEPITPPAPQNNPLAADTQIAALDNPSVITRGVLGQSSTGTVNTAWAETYGTKLCTALGEVVSLPDGDKNLTVLEVGLIVDGSRVRLETPARVMASGGSQLDSAGLKAVEVLQAKGLPAWPGEESRSVRYLVTVEGDRQMLCKETSYQS